MTHRERERASKRRESDAMRDGKVNKIEEHTHSKREGRGRERRGESVFVLLYVRCAISLPCELLKNQRKSTTKIVP